MSYLNREICKEEENVFHLKTKNFFRLPLKQIGTSIYEIKTHYMTNDTMKVIPSTCSSHLAGIRDNLLRHLEGDSFMYRNNIVSGSAIETTRAKQPSFVVVMDSLVLAMDFQIETRPSDVKCDVLIAICGQPVIVLTLVEEDKDSDCVTIYNTSVARGVTTTLRKFMDESINVVFGVLHLKDLEEMDTLQEALQKLATNSSLFVPSSSLSSTPSKYEKIVTAFWAGVAETKSVISKDGKVDTDYLRFLTKDQCIILMENINKKEVEVQFEPGTGATTLMVEVARRLGRLENTLLVCWSQEEKERLKSVYPNTETVADLRMPDLSKYTNIVEETGTVTGHATGKLWRFRTVYSELEQLEHIVETLEMQNENTEKMIYLLSSADRRDKMNHLSRETEILKLFDIGFQGLLSAYLLPSGLVHEIEPVKRNPDDQGDRDRRLETEDYMRHVLDQLKRGIEGRRDLFPLLADMMKQIKGILPYLQAKADHLELVGKSGVTQSRGDGISEVTDSEKTEKPKKKQETLKTVFKTVFTKAKRGKSGASQRRGDDKHEVKDSGKTERPKTKLETLKTIFKTVFTKAKPTSGNLQSEDREKQTGVSVDEGLPSLGHEKHVNQTDKDDETVSTKSSDFELEEIPKVHGGTSGVTQSSGDDMNDVTDSEKTEELKKKLETLKTEAARKQQELREVREGTDYGVEWEFNMNCLSQNMAQLKIQDVITDVIGEDQIPVTSDKQMKPNGCLDGGSSTRRREMRPCLIYHLRKLQFGTLRQKDLMDFVRDVITVDQKRLTNLRTQSDRLERVYGSPVHIVGEVDTEHSGPVSCPPMTFNRERVSKCVTVSGDGLEMVNSWSGDHHDGQYRWYRGTCSRLPITLPLSPSTLTVPQYWETHSRVQVGRLYGPLLEMGLCGEGEVDTKMWVHYQTRSSWSVIVIDCGEHDGYCTQVWENGRQVGGCHDTVSRTLGTDLIYKLGIALDMGRGRLAFLDVKRGRVLHRLDIKVDESLVPMFSVWSLSGVQIKMRLVSGSQLPITDTHKHLIAKALYSP